MGEVGLWRVRGFPTHRSPLAILDEIAAQHAERAKVLQTIRGLL